MIRFGGNQVNMQLLSHRPASGYEDDNVPITLSPLKRVVKMSTPLFGRKKSKDVSYGQMDSDDENSEPGTAAGASSSAVEGRSERSTRRRTTRTTATLSGACSTTP